MSSFLLRDKEVVPSFKRPKNLQLSPGAKLFWVLGGANATTRFGTSVTLGQAELALLDKISEKSREPMAEPEKALAIKLYSKGVLESRIHNCEPRTQSLLAKNGRTAQGTEFLLQVHPLIAAGHDCGAVRKIKYELGSLGARITNRRIKSGIGLFFIVNDKLQNHVKELSMVPPCVAVLLDATGATIFVIPESGKALKYLWLSIALSKREKILQEGTRAALYSPHLIAEAILTQIFHHRKETVTRIDAAARERIGEATYQDRAKIAEFLDCTNPLSRGVQHLRIDDLCGIPFVKRAILSAAWPTTEYESGGSNSFATMGVASDAVTAIDIAVSEYCERHAVMAPCSAPNARHSEWVDGIDLMTGAPCKAHCSDVYIYQRKSPYFKEKSDTSGTAFHSCLNRALSSALNELIERHLVTLWWYCKKETPARPISDALLRRLFPEFGNRSWRQFRVVDLSPDIGPYLYVALAATNDGMILASHCSSNSKIALRKSIYDVLSIMDLSNRRKENGLNGYEHSFDLSLPSCDKPFQDLKGRDRTVDELEALRALFRGWQQPVQYFDITPQYMRGRVVRTRSPGLYMLYKPNDWSGFKRRWANVPWFSAANDSVLLKDHTPYKLDERVSCR